MDYMEEHFPDYYAQVVFKLSDEMKADKSRHYFKATRDFRYSLLVGDPMKAFLSHGKKWKDKEKKIQYGQSHVRKYHDAVVRCAEFSGGDHLSQQYLDEMSAYIDSMKREKAAAKQNNQIEEKDADPIGIDLYGKIAEWAIEEGTPSGIFLAHKLDLTKHIAVFVSFLTSSITFTRFNCTAGQQYRWHGRLLNDTM